MSKGKAQKILIIVGPTASGKSDLAVALAKKFNGEVISADSRQVYRGLNIGAGKITRREMKGVPHHLLDVASPKTVFTVADYQRLAQEKIAAISQRGKLPILCGGSGFYISAVIDQLTIPAVPPNPTLRKKLEPLTKTPAGIEQLWRKLRRLNPERAATIDRHNPRRLVRAIEIATAKTSDVKNTQTSDVRLDPLFIGLKWPPEKLKERIHARLLRRMKQGMLTEIRRLHHQAGVSWKRLDDLGLEYRYLSRQLRDPKNNWVEKLETEIRRYAKRQLTWFKRDRRIQWLDNEGTAVRLISRWLATTVAHQHQTGDKEHGGSKRRK